VGKFWVGLCVWVGGGERAGAGGGGGRVDGGAGSGRRWVRELKGGGVGGWGRGVGRGGVGGEGGGEKRCSGVRYVGGGTKKNPGSFCRGHGPER